MKAFQLKVTIMGSEPSIWRRIIVPAGITFSQFSMILNEAMGWSGEHLFEFEFKKAHMQTSILENVEEMDYGMEDCVEASKTYIREYLEEYKGFTYVYDFGDDWRHQVKVEKIIEDYEYNYPIVLEYQENCPIEDCGGIFGYYDYLETLNKGWESEDEEIWDEMEEQEEYDIHEVNEVLKTYYFYQFGQKESRSQESIYEEIFSKECGLRAVKQDSNKNFGIIEFESYRKEKEKNFKRQLEQMFGYKEEWEKNVIGISLQEIFSDYTKEDLREIAKEKGMKGIYKWNKNTLIQNLIEYMLQPDVMKSYFLCLQDEEIAEFEKACDVEGLYIPEDVGNFTMLYDTSYVGGLMDGRFIVPKEVLEAYKSFKGKEFEEARKKNSYFLCCLNTATALYGVTPIPVLERLVAQNSDIQMTKVEIKEAINQIPEEIKECILVEDIVYRKDLYPDNKELLEVQGQKEFYIPTFQEILEFGKNGYCSDSTEIKKLKQFLKKIMNATQEEADLVSKIIQLQITAGCDMEDLFQIFEELHLGVQRESQAKELVERIGDVYNTTRLITNRGFTQNELLKKQNKVQVLPEKKKQNENNIINFAEAKKNKIYPNEPCPCGSGKKYKMCCRNKK